ncbi:MAG: hypothetical protein V1787_04515 [Candidatus Micrarchaeota archaeon]
MPRKSRTSKASKWLWNAAKAVAFGLYRLLVWILRGLWRTLSLMFRHGGRAVSSAVRRSVNTASAATGKKPAYSAFFEVRAFEGSLAGFEEWLFSSKSTVGIILGSRGSGKSGLGMRMLENWAAGGRKACAMGFDQSALPSYIRVVESAEQAPNGSVLLVDEGGILFGSRDSMSGANKLLSKLLFVARHKDLAIVFVSQNSANLEINSIRQADYLLLKRPSLLQKDFERGKIQEIYSAVSKDFKELSGDKGLVYIYGDAFRGFASNGLPSFWSERTGKAFSRKGLAK